MMEETYFVIVTAEFFNENSGEIETEIQLFKAANCTDLGQQLDEYYGKDISNYKVKWINQQIFLTQELAEELYACN